MRDRQLQHHCNNNSSSSQSSQSSNHYDRSPEERTLFQYMLQNVEILGQSLVQRQHQQQWYLHVIRIATKTVCYSIKCYYVTDVLTNNLQQVISNFVNLSLQLCIYSPPQFLQSGIYVITNSFFCEAVSTHKVCKSKYTLIILYWLERGKGMGEGS